MVGVSVVVGVAVVVGVWLGVLELVGMPCVKVYVGVWVAKTTGVQEAATVGVLEVRSPLPGARSTATSPAQ